jgi:uncharacterized membrane protein YdjX (TVP38/TMEM64 family)
MPDAPPRPAVVLHRLVPLALLLAAGAALVAAGGHKWLSLAGLAQNRAWLCGFVERSGVAGAALYVAVYAIVVALAVPGGAILTVAGGFLFGTWIGASCAVVGATCGAAGVFLAARAGLGGLAERASPFLSKLEAGFRADAFNYLLFLRLIPLFPFWLVNLIPAVASVSLPVFLAATFLGIIPGTLVYASLGSGFGQVAAQPGLAIVFRPSVLAPIVGLAVLALAPVWYRRWRKRRR